ncbi:MAG: MBL fold metallo-hydrolase [Thermoanaerobaculia bacterium]|nr:MBL fold metallo-hydrolase [Thermoanaerobaculia bacterium]
MILERFTVGPFAENTYIIGKTPEVAIIDPGGSSDEIAELIESRGWKPQAILLTHGHIDHIAHVAHLAERYGIGCRIHRGDDWLLRTPQFPELEAMMGARPCPEPESYFEDGDALEVAGLQLRVVHTPGHSPGGVCFVDEESGTIVVGDTIFRRGIGRTDLPGGSLAELEDSIRERLFTLERDYTLWPGHGPETSLEEEREDNPYFGRHAPPLAVPT